MYSSFIKFHPSSCLVFKVLQSKSSKMRRVKFRLLINLSRLLLAYSLNGAISSSVRTTCHSQITCSDLFVPKASESSGNHGARVRACQQRIGFVANKNPAVLAEGLARDSGTEDIVREVLTPLDDALVFMRIDPDVRSLNWR